MSISRDKYQKFQEKIKNFKIRLRKLSALLIKKKENKEIENVRENIKHI